MFKFQWRRPGNLVDALQHKAQKIPDQVAFVFLEDGEAESARITYAELDAKARNIAAYLQNNQIDGQMVILLYPTGLDFIAAFMGCLYAGCVAVPASCPAVAEFKKSEAILLTQAKNSGAGTVLTISSYVPLLKDLFPNTMRITETTNLPATTHYKKPHIDDNTITHLQYTSGSTSAPKGVITRHKNLLQSLKNHIESWGYADGSVTLSWTPHSHVYGLLGGLLVPLYHGSLGVIMPPSECIRKPANWLQAISKYRVSHSGGPNFAYELCVQRIRPEELEGLDLSAWKVAPAAGEPVRYLTLQKFTQMLEAYGFQIQHFCSSYGMSEATGLIAANLPETPVTIARLQRSGLLDNLVIETADSSNARDIVSSGRIVSGLDAVIVNMDTLSALPDGMIGEIWLAGDTISSGYWNQPDDAESVFNNQLADRTARYFRTGDLGYLQQGHLFLTGRLKEVIIIYGKKYYPMDIETIAAQTNQEATSGCENMVFSIEKGGMEKVILIQEITHDLDKAGKEELISSIRQAITEKMKIDLYGVGLVEKQALPRTPGGKLSRKMCQTSFLEDKFSWLGAYFKEDAVSKPQAVPSDSSVLSHFLDDLMTVISTELHIKREDMQPADNLAKYGFDSINIVNMVSSLNTMFGLNLTPANLFEYKTVNDIGVDLLEKHAQLFADYYHTSLPVNQDTSTGTAPLSRDSQTDDIAIIGMHGVFPGSADPDIFWDNVINGKDLISEVPASRWNWKDFETKVQWGGFINGVDQFDARFFSISPIEAELMDPQQRLFLEVVWKTIEDSGCSLDELAKAKTSLFVGVSASDYRELVHKTRQTSPYLITGVYHSLLPNRISYLLNLSGSSEAIDTACSSSLVAIHHAVKAIQNGDCDLAIAGGVNLNLFPDLFLTFSKAGMLCEDGRCKTFDKSANGYVRGEGAGAILLKPLAKARADGDLIYAVIKGSATNHGGHVNSLTVPNPNAQAAVIMDACERANVDIETIGYVEAHGTGTPIGDPIEINGLKKAYQALSRKQNKTNPKTHYCGVGSVKTNIGHLEPAAGIAGVIKVLLAMQHGRIPGLVNFKELNPFIDLKDSPFYIVNESQEWAAFTDDAGNTLPRRAGVSSFGIGGSNAHVILEEEPDTGAASKPCKPAYLLCLSAKSLTALKQKSLDLENWLRKTEHMTVNQHRTIEDISYTLNHGRNHFDYRYAFVVNSLDELREKIAEVNRNHVFNSIVKHPASNNPQQENQAQTLYNQLATPDASYNNNLASLAELYMSGYNLDWDSLHFGESKRRVSLPTYPFDKQRYWLEEKQASLSLPSTVSHPLLDSINPPFSKKFSGKESYVSDHRVNHIPTVPGAVFLEMARAAASLAVSESITSISNVLFAAPFQPNDANNELTVHLYEDTFAISSADGDMHAQGKWHTDEVPPLQTVSLDISRIRERCQIRHSTEELYRQFASDGLEYGPVFQLIQEIDRNEQEAIARLKLPADEASQFILHPGLLDGAFQAISVLQTQNNSGQKLLYLPFGIEKIDMYAAITHDCYAYVKKAPSNNPMMPKYDIDITDETGAILVRVSNFTLRGMKQEARVYYYKPVWKQSAERADLPLITGPILVVDQDDKLAALLRQHIPGVTVLHASPTDEFFQDLREFPRHIIYHSHSSSIGSTDKLHELFYLSQALLQQKPKEKITLLLLNNEQQAMPNIFAEALAGFVKSLHIEQPMIMPRMIRLEDAKLEHVVRELSQTAESVRYDKQGRRWIGHYAEIERATNAVVLKTGGTYLITGGMGGLGLLFANYLVKSWQANIVLLGRATLQDSQQAVLADLQQAGGGVMYVQVDITKEVPLTQALQTIKARFGAINGILHSAGVIRDNFVFKKTREEMDAVIAPKVYGSLYLDELTQAEPLDFFVLFSSVASIFGNTGQSDYAYANRFMDSFAEYRHQQHRQGRSIAINWPLWAEGGMRIDEATKQWLKQSMGMDLLGTADGMAAFVAALSCDSSQSIVLAGEKEKLEHALYGNPVEIETDQVATSSINNTELQQKTERYLKELLSSVTKISLDELQANEHFETYGIDSLMIVSLNQQMEQSFRDLPKTLFFEYTTLEALTQYFIENHTPTLLGKFNMSATPVAPGVQPQVILAPQPVPLEKPASDAHDIAIIGISGQYPMADDLDIFWENLKAGKDCITEIPADRWDYHLDYDADKNKDGKSHSKWGGFIDDVDKFDTLFFNISPHEAELIDPQERLFLQTAWKTIEDAGYSKESLSGQQVAVFVGVMYGHYQLYGEDESLKGHTMATLSSYASIANRVSYFLNVHGPSMALDTMCSSSLTSIHLACQSILNHECEMAIAGGVNVSIHPNKYIALSQGKFVSSDGRCRSFGEGGDGYVPGEGVGAVLLKPLSQALQDNDHIYGVIKGSSLNHGGKTNSYTVPSPTAQAAVIENAFKNASVNPAEISYLEAHGTGTSLGDPIEIAGLSKAFGLQQRDIPCPIGSVKSNIGHCESAAGIAALSKVLLQMRHKLLVPSLHSETLNANINWANTPFKVQQEIRDWKCLAAGIPRRAGISSFGAGGSNAHLIVEEAPERIHAGQALLKACYLLTLSAKTDTALSTRIDNLASWLDMQTDSPSLEDISYTLNQGRSHFEKRCALVVSSLAELRDTLQALKNGAQLDNAFLSLEKKDKAHDQAIFKKLFAQLMRELADVKQTSSADYRDTLLALANFYVDGYSLDWQRLHANEAMRKISLPTYPFDKERYWVKQSTSARITVDGLHPLLDSTLSISKAQCFSKTFSGQEFYLNDHRVKQNAILPAAAYLEMARAAGEHALPEWRVAGLRNVLWVSPIQIDQQAQMVTISLYSAKTDVDFEVTTSHKQTDGHLEPVMHHAQGKIHYALKDQPEPVAIPLNIAEIKQRCSQQKTHAQVYADFKTAGFAYGPAFQVIQELSSNKLEALARIQLPEHLQNNKDQFVLHPSLLDGVLQASAEILQDEPGLYLPFSMAQLDIYGPLVATSYVYVTASSGSTTMPGFDIQVADEAGQLLLVIKDFKVRAVQVNGAVKNEVSAELVPEANEEEHPANATELRQKTDVLIKNVLSEVISLAPERIKSSQSFESYGIDSVMIVKLNRLLEDIFGDLPKTLFFEYASTAELTDYFIENHAEFLIQKLSPHSTNTAATPSVSVAPVSQPLFSMQTPVEKLVNNNDDIAIIGMSGRFPQAKNVDEFWNNLKAGKDAIREIPRERWDYHDDFDPDKTKAGKTYSKWGGFMDDIDKFDPLFFNISPREAELLDPQERIFLETSWQTIEDAGYTFEKLSDSKIGVFVGAMYGEYQLYGAEESLKGHVTALSSSHASIANRVSYYLNFHGPSIAIDTMCSSSLTAIHLACKFIRDGECQLALAGGVNLSLHPNKYILLSQGKFLASDGHCHSFGEGGDGYVPGEGVGAVLLKPLAQALADGDHIYGVIKGSSINHGGRTNGYTVPNPAAQATLIRDIFEKTGISPDTISYLEAHGTGTSLGDPIEIGGLSKVFGHQQRENAIAIGSVKSNVGHLESAAGIAALTKVLLQMQYKALVPSIYSDTLNPNINWEKTPFKVQHEYREWTRLQGINQEIPRRAGISAFGAGGSNAHMIIEEAPEIALNQSSNKPAYLLSLSAKTDTALMQRVADLSEWLHQHADVSLEAVSATLNLGRSHFNKRAVLVASSIEELKERLSELQEGKHSEAYFQGDASKNPDDAAIYEQVLSTTLEELQSTIDVEPYRKKLEALANLYAKGYDLDWKLLHQGELSRKISLPTYPFAKERYWVPDPSARDLRHMLEPAAAMHPLLDTNASTMETECFTKLFTGTEFYLTDHRVNGNSVLPGAVYLEMARAAGKFALPTHAVIGLRNIIFAQPVLVEGGSHSVTISIYPDEVSVRFELTTEQEGADPIIHAEGKIMYASEGHDAPVAKPDIDIEALLASCSRKQLSEEIYASFDAFGLQYGAGFQVIEYLCNNEREAIAKIRLPEHLENNANHFMLHPSILDGAFQAICGLKQTLSADNALFLPFSICDVDIFAALPSVCYVYVTRKTAAKSDLTKFQIQITDEAGRVLVHINDFTVRLLPVKKQENTRLAYYQTVWEQQPLVAEDAGISGPVLVFDDDGSMVQALRERLPNQKIIQVLAGEDYKAVAPLLYQLDKHNAEQYIQLLNQLKDDDLAPGYIVYRATFSTAISASVIDEQLHEGFYPLFYLAQALIKYKPKQDIRVLCVNEMGDGKSSPFAAGISGFAKTVLLEHPKLFFGLVDIAGASVIDAVLQELTTQEIHSRYDHQQVRWLEGYEKFGPQPSTTPSVSLLKQGHVYVVTGGLGGLGLIFARHLAEHYQAKLVLMGRSELQEKQKAVIAELEQYGAEVLYVQADVAKPRELEETIAAVKSHFGAIHGVIHSAGMLRDAFILKKTPQNIADVFAPKIYGVALLDEMTKSEPLDFFMMFSSIASVFGNPGQCDYAYANGFIDSFAEYRRHNQRHGKSIVINWPLWADGGMQIDDASKQAMEQQFGLSLLPTTEGIIAFDDSLSLENEQLIVLYSRE